MLIQVTPFSDGQPSIGKTPPDHFAPLIIWRRSQKHPHVIPIPILILILYTFTLAETPSKYTYAYTLYFYFKTYIFIAQLERKLSLGNIIFEGLLCDKLWDFQKHYFTKNSIFLKSKTASNIHEKARLNLELEEMECMTFKSALTPRAWPSNTYFYVKRSSV